MTTASAVQAIAANEVARRVRGQILRPGVFGYAEALERWQGNITGFPVAIVLATTPADIKAAYQVADELGLQTAVVWAAFPDVTALAPVDGGILIDVSSVTLDTPSTEYLLAAA
jgi:hypothetical protein